MADIQKLTIHLEALKERLTESESRLLRATRLAKSACLSLESGDIATSQQFIRLLIDTVAEYFYEEPKQ